MKDFFIGVDGGATKCIVRVENAAGELMGRAIGGPANIRISVEKSGDTILNTLTAILEAQGLSLTDKQCRFYAGMGLAGCEMTRAHQAFLKYATFFAHLEVVSDAYIACLAAHQGENGTVLISGTGTVGLKIVDAQMAKVGGWGFPHDDVGSGAWLGWQAMQQTLRYLDGRAQASTLTQSIYAQFADNQQQLLDWLYRANSTLYAELAPIVIEQAACGDEDAKALLYQAAVALEAIDQALNNALPQFADLPCALVGTIAPFLQPYLSDKIKKRLRPSQATSDLGALFLIKKSLVSLKKAAHE